MCNINTETKKRKITGYKIVVNFDNNYYSPVSGMLIKEGLVANKPIFKKHSMFRNMIDTEFYSDILSDKVSIFRTFRDAKESLDLIQVDLEVKRRNKRLLLDIENLRTIAFAILKITISNNIYVGTLGHFVGGCNHDAICYAGSFINSYKCIYNLEFNTQYNENSRN